MFAIKFVAVGGLLLLPFAASMPTYSSSQPICDVANFDNYPVSIVNVNYIDEYKNIFWQGMTVGSSTLQLTGVKAHSGDNVASLHFADSKTDTFDLYSFAYGCALPTLQGAVAVPSKCTITVKGYFDSGDSVEKQVTYDPTGPDQQMVGTPDGLFSNFKNLKEVTLQAGGILGGSALVVGLIDDVCFVPKLKGE
ncbi:hypothetical protein H072_4244 [Dactylellina haptotyla CBS 200.50]|uniref:ML-like domain-containing protein n=1 Tax=Dactylellina haptotyla (strain CBS 200.50) TaxID=1284197 RepID=S8BR04_DACHA|nr:hypothetical protein H072_4244 [Dactylellina haptotyla CBS 200.50]